MRRLAAALVLALVAGPAAAGPRDPGATRARLDALAQQIASVDRELDAIDAELVAADRVSGMGRIDALAQLEARRAALVAARLDTASPPPELADAQAAYLRARLHVLDLGRDLGARNPEMIAAQQQVDRAAARFTAQQNVELAECAAWAKALQALPERATPAAVHDARIHALRHLITDAPLSDAMPGDVPAALRLAFDELVAARDAYADLSHDLGPKHPELIAARERLDAALRALPAARAAALHELDAPPPRGVVISHRAELAARARLLRAQYEALLNP